VVACSGAAPGRLQLVAAVRAAQLLHGAVGAPGQLQRDVRAHARVRDLAVGLRAFAARA